VDRHLIGEELVEPDEQNQFDAVDDDLYDEYESGPVNNSLSVDGKQREAGVNLLEDFEQEIQNEETKTEEKPAMGGMDGLGHRERSQSMV